MDPSRTSVLHVSNVSISSQTDKSVILIMVTLRFIGHLSVMSYPLCSCVSVVFLWQKLSLKSHVSDPLSPPWCFSALYLNQMKDFSLRRSGSEVIWETSWGNVRQLSSSQSETSCVSEERRPISDFKCETVWFSVFTGSDQILFCWGEEETLEDSAPGQNLLNHWHWRIQTRRRLQLPWSHTALWCPQHCLQL